MNGENEKKPLDVESSGKEQDSGSGAPLGICFGCAFGLLVQVLTGDIIWLPVGVAVGYGLGFTLGNSGKGRQK